MRTITFAIALFATALIGALSGPSAQAQALRTFVSGTGSDSNPCTLALPCRTFQYAHDNTAAGGEIDVLTPGGYGPLTISKAISVEGHDYAGITAGANGVTAITVNAGSTDAIALRGLILEGAGVGAEGIHFTTGKSLSIQNCVIQHFANTGMDIAPTAAMILSVLNTVVSYNVGPGIIISPEGSGLLR
ncbi:MAG TPA: hypothetical protein VHT93_01930 [Pseudolabrys sp.]|jgi:hypothetical protein|nr:hypothetical protein [Pseudolabrys sp.]